jgi:putative transcriptional regulator
MTAKTDIEKGKLLLAEPFMSDPYFKRAVILLCEHHPQGSLGFILNKPTDVLLNELLEDFPEFEANIYYGGPVQTDRLHYIHNLGDLLTDSLQVCDGVWWGGDFTELQFLIKSELVLPANIRFFVGYSGWSAGQLMEEMETGSWVTADMHANYLFKSEPAGMWSEVMYNKGSAYQVLADLPDETALN